MKKLTFILISVFFLSSIIYGDTSYFFIRALVDGLYNINNSARVDVSGNQILLSTEIAENLPGKRIVIRCDGVTTNIIFDIELTEPEETTLNIVVSDHKNNT